MKPKARFSEKNCCHTREAVANRWLWTWRCLVEWNLMSCAIATIVLLPLWYDAKVVFILCKVVVTQWVQQLSMITNTWRCRLWWPGSWDAITSGLCAATCCRLWSRLGDAARCEVFKFCGHEIWFGRHSKGYAVVNVCIYWINEIAEFMVGVGECKLLNLYGNQRWGRGWEVFVGGEAKGWRVDSRQNEKWDKTTAPMKAPWSDGR